MKRSLFRALAAVLLAIVALGTLAACNTVGGFGEDLQILGEKMERKADQISYDDRY